MTILHITPSYLPAYVYGGPTLSVSRLCAAQARAGHVPEVYTTTANGASELPVQRVAVEGVWVRYFPRLTGDHSHLSPALWWAAWRHCRHYDLVHIHSWWNLVAMPAAVLCLLRGVRPVVSPRGMLSPYTLRRASRRWFHRWVGRPLLRRCVLHATSALEARVDLAFARPERVFVAPNLVDLPAPPSAPGPAFFPEGVLRLAFVSRIDPVKRLELLFHALASLGAPWRLVIAGTGTAAYTEELQRLAARLGIAERIEWVGWLEGERKTALLAGADLLVLPSHNENFANIVLEALALGTPALLTDTVGLSDYVAQHGFGWVCAGTEEALCAALERAGAGTGVSRAAMRARVLEDFAEGEVLRGYGQGKGIKTREKRLRRIFY